MSKTKTPKTAAKANLQPKPQPKSRPKPGKARAIATSDKAAPASAAPTVVSPTCKEIFDAFVTEVLNGAKFELAERYLDPVVVTHNPFPGQPQGIDGFVAVLRAFRTAFPDLRYAASHQVAEGDKVVGRFEVQGTHQGDFMGLSPTGRSIHYEEIVIVRFAGGRIIEHWAVADALAILQQLGKSESG